MPGSPKKREPITPAIFNRICREIASGKSLRRVLKGKGMPGMHKFFDHLEAHPQAGEHYARARQRGIESHIDQIVDLADSATEQNSRAVQLRVDTRKWIASKILPRIYGDHRQLDVRVTRDDDLGARLRRAMERLEAKERARVIEQPPQPALPPPTETAVPELPPGFELVEGDAQSEE